MEPIRPWSQAEEPIRVAIRRRSILALRDLYADFSVPPALDETTLPALDGALDLYVRALPLIGRARVKEAAENLGCLAGEILVSRRGGRWVVDQAEERLGVKAKGVSVAEPVRWAMERASGRGPSLEERIDTWIGESVA